MQQTLQSNFTTPAMAIAAAMMEPNQVKYVPEGTGAAYWGPGDHVRFLITGDKTGGAPSSWRKSLSRRAEVYLRISIVARMSHSASWKGR